MGTYIFFFFLLFLILIPPLHSNLFSTFITPWADQSAAHTVEPDFHLPACYNVHPPAPGPAKVAAFSDETLFFMFYSSPRDALQEVAAQEL
jgi:CCR4-NOT transcription complex subunit 2